MAKFLKVLSFSIVSVFLSVCAHADVSTPYVTIPSTVTTTVIDLKADCGAVGDGVVNDTQAFQIAAQRLQTTNGGILNIPAGTYIVGEQYHQAGKYPYYKTKPLFKVQGLAGLLIEGNNAVIKIAPGLRFGSFDKDTGDVYTPPAMPFVNSSYRVGDIMLFSIRQSQNIIIRNLEINGNSPDLILGGPWGDKGRQIPAYGFFLHGNSNVHIDQVKAHHLALDGMSIGSPGLLETDPPTPHFITDSQFEYNGRQGLSWVGGRGLSVYRSKFNHTGRSVNNNGLALVTAPASGLDIEAENAVVRDGYFEDCEFIDNQGAGMVAESGNGGYTTFKRCTFWGTTNFSAWARKPGLKFEDSSFYGGVVHAVGSADANLATQWIGCYFEDRPWTNGKVYRGNSGSFLLEVSGNLKNVLVKDCNFVANTCRAVWTTGTSTGRINFEGTTITHKKSDLPTHSYQSLFRHANFTGCHFKESFAVDSTGLWYIGVENQGVAAAPSTVVEGPRVKWKNWSWGVTGTIAPTPIIP